MTTSTTFDRYFNVHTEGMGYLSNFEERDGRNGKFYMLTFCMIEGKASNAETQYVNCTVSCKQALEIIKPFDTEINNRDIKVFCGLRIAKYRAKPFVYPSGSPKAGELGVNYSGNLIKLMYLKVADREIKLPKTDSRATTDYGIPAKAQVQPTPVNTVNVETASTDKPHQVKLSKSDPDFEVTKQRLKDAGYKWNKDDYCWELPSGKAPKQDKPSLDVPGAQTGPTNKPIRVELRKDDPIFETAKQNLKDDGYKWNGDEGCWQLPTYTIANDDPNRASKERDLEHLGYVNRGNGVWNVAFGRSQYHKNAQNGVQAA